MTDTDFYGFPPSSKKDWLEQVKKDLKGKDFDATLVSPLWDELKIQPLYTAGDVSEEVSTMRFHPSPKIPGGSPRNWKNIVSIYVTDSKAANGEILSVLDSGAEGVVLHLDGTEDLNQLLHGVLTEYVQLYFLPTAKIDLVISEIHNWVNSLNLTSEMLHGAILWSPADAFLDGDSDWSGNLARAKELIESFASFPDFYPITIDLAKYANAGATGIQELYLGLGEVIELIDQLMKQAVSGFEAHSNFAFHLTAGASHFAEIAKLKAFRNLAVDLASNLGIQIEAESIHLIVSSSDWTKSLIDKDTNLIRQTFESMAAVLGGCNSLWVKPAGGAHASGQDKRIARNISAILSDESHLNKVIDPAAGSYYLTHLQQEIEKLVLEKLRGLEEKEGWMKNVENASIQQEIRQTAKQDQHSVVTGSKVKVGVNNYRPDEGEENNLPFEQIVDGEDKLLKTRSTYPIELQNLKNL